MRRKGLTTDRWRQKQMLIKIERDVDRKERDVDEKVRESMREQLLVRKKDTSRCKLESARERIKSVQHFEDLRSDKKTTKIF